MKRIYGILIFLLLCVVQLCARSVRVWGYVVDSDNRGIELANVVVIEDEGARNQEQGLKGHILIPCGDGNAIDLLELQLPGKKRMDAKSLLNGLK